jgi:hypothetical protein
MDEELLFFLRFVVENFQFMSKALKYSNLARFLLDKGVAFFDCGDYAPCPKTNRVVATRHRE